MCQISRETVRRANKRMIERGARRTYRSTVSSDGNFNISVMANGKIYSQVITREQIREAYGKVLVKNGMCHGA